ncbi:phytanoyl-CoA dioxygenase family protein [Kitasatospora sp. NPDC058965]|uniref:phytanoyl-CoA dioxygenase family protein n=1 Tax=Kitasatospora sp. NPDC058965 TaxID=3346682 RepID=UPI003678F942
MTAITDQMRRTFRTDGYLVVPGVLDARQLADARADTAALLDAEPAPAGHTGPDFRWPRFGPQGHPLLDLYHRAGLGELGAQLLRPDLPLQEPDFAQLATTVPPWPQRPGGPHVDGLTPGEPSGRPGTFSLLAGLWLTDHQAPDRGNLWVWPGTHLRFGAYLAERGADALTRIDELGPGPYPRIDLGEPVQLTGPAGSALFAHYLLAHNIGNHDGRSGDPRRETVYYRLHATGHRARWRAAVTDPLLEFRPVPDR